jgi:hypothetical protein
LLSRQFQETVTLTVLVNPELDGVTLMFSEKTVPLMVDVREESFRVEKLAERASSRVDWAITAALNS